MPRPIQFKLFRYALVPFEQMDITEPQLPEPKGKAIEVVTNPDGPPTLFEYRARQFAFVGFSYIGGAEPSRFLLGRLAKRNEVGIGELRERDVVEVNTEDWIPIWMIIDTERQYFAMELNSRFGDLSHMMNVTQTGFSDTVEQQYRHEVIVSPVSNSKRFWEIVEESQYIYRALFHLVSPNFLDTPRTVQDALRQWQRLYNQTTADIQLANDDGALQIPEDDLADTVDYISAGEGAWRLEVADTRDGVQRSYSSRDKTETFNVDVPRASRPAEELEAAPDKETTLLTRLLEVLTNRDAA